VLTYKLSTGNIFHRGLYTNNPQGTNKISTGDVVHRLSTELSTEVGMEVARELA